MIRSKIFMRQIKRINKRVTKPGIRQTRKGINARIEKPTKKWVRESR